MQERPEPLLFSFEGELEVQHPLEPLGLPAWPRLVPTAAEVLVSPPVAPAPKELVEKVHQPY